MILDYCKELFSLKNTLFLRRKDKKLDNFILTEEWVYLSIIFIQYL